MLTIHELTNGNWAVDDGSGKPPVTACPCCARPFASAKFAAAFVEAYEKKGLDLDTARELLRLGPSA